MTSNYRDGGKGDKPRPLGVPMDIFDKNFELVFGKKEKKDGNETKTTEKDNTQGSGAN